MRKFNKMFPAVIALLASFAMLATASYAWYSMNTKADATGMELKTTAPTNMLISTDAQTWKNGSTTLTDVAGGFSPASTTNGYTFFALSDSTGLETEGGVVTAGSSVEFGKVGRTDGVNAFYAEVALYIKASNDLTESADLNMSLSELAVTTTSETDIAKCVRISVTEVGRNTGLIGFDNAGDAYLLDSEGNLTSTKVTPEGDTTIYKYDAATTVAPITSLSHDTYGTATLASDTAIEAGGDEVCFTVDYTAAEYTTIIVRIWLEGQHVNCINEITGETISVSLSWEVKRS